VEAAASDEATPDQLAQLEGEPHRWLRTLDDLLDETEDALDALRAASAPSQIVADYEGERRRLLDAVNRLLGIDGDDDVVVDGATSVAEPVGAVQLHVSWSGGQVVAWAAGAGLAPASRDELPMWLEKAGAPASGWTRHSTVALPSGPSAPALVSPVRNALGWLVSVGSGTDEAEGGAPDVGASVRWLGRVAVWAVRLVAQGSIVPTLRSRTRSRARQQPEQGLSEFSVRWAPALVDQALLAQLVAAMPGAVAAIETAADPQDLTLSALGSMVHAIATDAAGRVELPAPPPDPRSPAAIAEAVVTRLDGSRFAAPTRAGGQLAKRLDAWAQPVSKASDSRLVVQLDPPDKGDAWFLSVLGPDPDGQLIPVEVALVDSASRKSVAEHLARLERLLPVLLRPGGLRRGQVYLSSDEAWDLMTVTGPAVAAAGFDVRVPALSRRRPSPTLRLMAEPHDPSVVGAHQLAQVRWSTVFDDIELTATQIAELAAQARPLVKSHGAWVELDKADLAEAAAALAERSSITQMTGAEVLRHAIGLEGSGLSGGISVAGSGWAADLLHKAEQTSTEPVTSPEGFRGELRAYQAEALAWLGYLDSVELGGCLALDMGLGKTPTVLAHLVRTAGHGPALVIAPPAVVGNWAAEAARFTPSLKVVVHHGAARASAAAMANEARNADLVITTYGTAVRDVEALAEQPWSRVILDEAQAIKNPANETSQQLRRIPSGLRLALTGTPVENGLGDLWAILDYTNPGLVGARPTFVAQLSASGDTSRQGTENALRALNGILIFRRTKSEPAVAAELPPRIDQLDHCTMTPEQIGLYQAVLDKLVAEKGTAEGDERGQGEILAAITALKQICNHPAAYQADDRGLAGRSGKLARLEEIVDAVFAADERVLVFTHFAEWGKQLATHLTARTGTKVECYHGGLSRTARDQIIAEFQQGEGAGALVLSLKAGGTGLNLTAASHVVLYDRWWNPAVEDQARDRAWRIGQTRTVVSHRLVCPGTVDERVEEVVEGKRRIADMVLPKSSTLADLDTSQLRVALGMGEGLLVADDPTDGSDPGEEAA